MRHRADSTKGRAARATAPEPLLRSYRFAEPVLVMRPTMPEPEKYHAKIQKIWDSRWIANDGELQRELVAALSRYLGVREISLCCNGTTALLIALQSLRINSGEVITTPFTFPATTHALYWNRVQPVFCDIDEKTYNLDPNRIEELVGAETRAILPVHVFGYPCDVDAIQAIADRHGLQVIYDAAHAMGVQLRGRSVLDHGDLAVLSFHATKLFSTGEGGAIVSRTDAQRKRIDFLKNFGIADEETVVGPGINGKLSELQAAFGIVHLEMIEQEIENRRRLIGIYRDRLCAVPGITYQDDLPDVRHNYSYMTILVDPDRYGRTRDELYVLLKQFNVHPRKYFYPLCNHIPSYASLPTADPGHLPVAERTAERILCLPLYGSLEDESVEKICAIIEGLAGGR